MEQSAGTYQMAVQQNISPAPNESPKAVDWLPKFAGFSWLAYGAHFSVVITMAPSPSNTGEVAMGGFFRQVLSTNWPKEDGEEKQSVSNIAWAPRGVSIGSLAAAAGKHIYLYLPEGCNCAEEGNQDPPELPLRWVKTHVLAHFSDVLSLSWSESGDGLLSIGLEIVMWQKNQTSWNCLWRSQLEQPQSLCTASWSAGGIAATAGGPSVAKKQATDGDHLVTIWCWEDGKDLLEVELSHPDQLLMIQWRPMRGFGSSSQSFRPVLLTCCRDGVVRLWAEIGNLGVPYAGISGLSNVDPTNVTDEAGDGYENQFKLAFFVSAVIDANSTLRGVLGQNIHITWPEGRGGGVRSSNGESEESSSSFVNKENEVDMNEWLIGIGPSGSITLWSIQSLDDLSPSRGPLIQFWQQRSGILPLPAAPSQGSNVAVERQCSPRAVRVVVHRPLGTFWGPPSSLDVFEVWSPRLLRWSCIWPPVAAIGGPTSKSVAPSSSGPANITAAGGKLSTWGVSSDVVVLGGHNGNIIQIAVHPVAAVRLVASLDDQGAVLLWDAKGSSSNPRSEVSGCLNPLWRHSGQLTDHRVNCGGRFNSMAWAPVVLPRDDTILLLCHSQGVDCFVISKILTVSKSKSKSFSLSHALLYTLHWPVSDDTHGLQGIYTVPSHLTVSDSPHVKNCIAIGVGSSGLKLASWKLEIQLQENRNDSQHLRRIHDVQETDVLDGPNVNDDPSKSSATVGGDTQSSKDVVAQNDSPEPLDGPLQNILLDACLLGVLNLGAGEQITSVATAAFDHWLRGHSGSRGDVNEVCDIITGGGDGVLKLWKVRGGSSVNSMLSVEIAGGWQCVGLLRCYDGPVSNVIFCGGTSKIASTGEMTPDVIDIWGADTFIEERGFCLEGRLRVSSPAVALSWLDGGNGSFILGVISQRNVQLFVECREQASRSGRGSSSGLSEDNLWTCLASLPATGFSASTLSWEAQGSLIVTLGGHIILYSNCVVPRSSYGSGLASSEACQGLTSGQGQASNSRGISSYEALLAHKNGTDDQSVGRLEEGENSDYADGLCSILEAAERIGCPLLDYHPTSLLSWISGGSRQSARASIRHLASYLLAQSSSANIGAQKTIFEATHERIKPKFPRTPLSEIFQEKEQLYSLQGQYSSDQLHMGKIPSSYLTTSSRGSFLDFTSAFNSGYQAEEQNSFIAPISVVKKGGLEPFSKTEVDLISSVLRESLVIPGLSADGKLQLLTIIDVLSEMDGVCQPSQIDGIDLPGQRFWLASRYSSLYAKWKNDEADKRIPMMESKAIAWALQSEFKENLLSRCLPEQSFSWPAMRALGMGYWFTDGVELRKLMEKLARAQYLSKKDPKDCALLYLALDRQTVLASLFKLSRDQKDRPLAEFLFRDFKDEKNQVAALKNAYVLMGKHRHELAAAFFILGRDINSAVVICAKNMHDPQLALVICSLMEVVNGPIGRDIILKYALPTARDTRDSWLASILQWLLGKGIESIQELIVKDGDLSTSSPETTGYSEGSETSPPFPLDQDVGRYCELLASKPRIRNSAGAAEASTLALIATTRSAAAMRRSGLSLQALEYLRGGGSINFEDSEIELTNDSFSDLGTPRTRPSPPSDICDFPLTDISGRRVGSGWVSRDVVAGIGRATRFTLALKCASQLLEDHPHWGGQTCSAWQNPVMSKQTETESKIASSTQHTDEDLDTSAKATDLSTFLEGADKRYDDDLKVLEKKYSVKLDGVVAALITFSRIHHRAYLRHRLFHGLQALTNAPDTGFHLASQSEISVPVAQYLDAFGTEAPLVLAWTVLSCGGAAAPQLGSNSEALQLKDTENPEVKPIRDKGGALPRFSFEELVRFGGEIQLLTKAAYQQDKSGFGKERGARALSLLSFIFFVAAAWLGRQTKALSRLIAPTVIDPTKTPEVPQGELDAVLWFRRLEVAQNAPHGHRPGKKPVEPVGFNMAGTVTIPSDDVWRVLGVSLWNHLLVYVRKQLTGTASEASYSGFGRVSSSQSQSATKSAFQGLTSQPHSAGASNTKAATFLGFNLQSSALSSTWLEFKSKVRDSYQSLPSAPAAGEGGGGSGEGATNSGKVPSIDGSSSSATDPDDFEVALLGSLTSVVAGLRKQLAAHLEHSLSKPEVDPLTLWLWGKPSPPTSAPKKPSAGSSALNFFNASSSNGQVGVSVTSGVTVYSQLEPNLFPTGAVGTEDRDVKELWELLVVREKVRSALGLEGVSGQRKKPENHENMSGWYSGRKGQAPDSAGAGGGVNAVCRVPPKRIMWNAVKGVSSISDQGVTLRSRREEQNSQMPRSQASEDGLHLSEEFSEADLEDPLPTVKKFVVPPISGNWTRYRMGEDICAPVKGL